ncbi:hypothetical protein CSUI_005211 [Cystoisospora suis]|uniref:Uncharacterized protein n=1 Tax=Cystoisospora suis TaxID=483139 RepID=A0A2C6KXV4_9APIC|nr:hypothetical protein CSUI_005211 [Cystoisospora suis]
MSGPGVCTAAHAPLGVILVAKRKGEEPAVLLSYFPSLSSSLTPPSLLSSSFSSPSYLPPQCLLTSSSSYLQDLSHIRNISLFNQGGIIATHAIHESCATPRQLPPSSCLPCSSSPSSSSPRRDRLLSPPPSPVRPSVWLSSFSSHRHTASVYAQKTEEEERVTPFSSSFSSSRPYTPKNVPISDTRREKKGQPLSPYRSIPPESSPRVSDVSVDKKKKHRHGGDSQCSLQDKEEGERERPLSKCLSRRIRSDQLGISHGSCQVASHKREKKEKSPSNGCGKSVYHLDTATSQSSRREVGCTAKGVRETSDFSSLRNQGASGVSSENEKRKNETIRRRRSVSIANEEKQERHREHRETLRRRRRTEEEEREDQTGEEVWRELAEILLPEDSCCTGEEFQLEIDTDSFLFGGRDRRRSKARKEETMSDDDFDSIDRREENERDKEGGENPQDSPYPRRLRFISFPYLFKHNDDLLNSHLSHEQSSSTRFSREQAENEIAAKGEEKAEVAPFRENKAIMKAERTELATHLRDVPGGGEATDRSTQQSEKKAPSSCVASSPSLSSSFLRMISEVPLRKLCSFPYTSLPFNASRENDSSGAAASEESSTQQGNSDGDQPHHYHPPGGHLNNNDNSLWLSREGLTSAEGLRGEKHPEHRVEKAEIGEIYGCAKDVLGEGSSTEVGRSLRRERKDLGSSRVQEKMKRDKRKQCLPHIKERQRPIEKFSLAFVFDANDDVSFISHAKTSPRLRRSVPSFPHVHLIPSNSRWGVYTGEGGGVTSMCSAAAQISGFLSQAFLLGEYHYGYLSKEMEKILHFISNPSRGFLPSSVCEATSFSSRSSSDYYPSHTCPSFSSAAGLAHLSNATRHPIETCSLFRHRLHHKRDKTKSGVRTPSRTSQTPPVKPSSSSRSSLSFSLLPVPSFSSLGNSPRSERRKPASTSCTSSSSSSSSSFSRSSEKSSPSWSSDQTSSPALLSSVIPSRSSSDNRDVHAGIRSSSHERRDGEEEVNAPTHRMPLSPATVAEVNTSSSSSSLGSVQGYSRSADRHRDGNDCYREVHGDRLSPSSLPHSTTSPATHQSRHLRRSLKQPEVSTDTIQSRLPASHSVCNSEGEEGEDREHEEEKKEEQLQSDRSKEGSKRGETPCRSAGGRDKERLRELCYLSSLIATLVSVVDQLQATGLATVHLPECMMMTCQLSLRGRSLSTQPRLLLEDQRRDCFLTPDHSLALLHSSDTILNFTFSTFSKRPERIPSSSSSSSALSSFSSCPSSFTKVLRELSQRASPSVSLRELQDALHLSSYAELHALADYLLSWRLARAVDRIEDFYSYSIDATLPLKSLLSVSMEKTEKKRPFSSVSSPSSLKKKTGEETQDKCEKDLLHIASVPLSSDVTLHGSGGARGSHSEHETCMPKRHDEEVRKQEIMRGGERKGEEKEKTGNVGLSEKKTGIFTDKREGSSISSRSVSLHTKEKLGVDLDKDEREKEEVEDEESEEEDEKDEFRNLFPSCPLSFAEMLELFCQYPTVHQVRKAFLQRTLLRDFYQAHDHSLSSCRSSFSSSSLASSSPSPSRCISLVDEEHRTRKRSPSLDHPPCQETISSSSLISPEETFQSRREEKARHRNRDRMRDAVISKDVEMHARRRRRRRDLEELFRRILDWFVATEILIRLKRYFFFWPVVLLFLDETDSRNEEKKLSRGQTFEANKALACILQSVSEEKRENEKERWGTSEGIGETLASAHLGPSLVELHGHNLRRQGGKETDARQDEEDEKEGHRTFRCSCLSEGQSEKEGEEKEEKGREEGDSFLTFRSISLDVDERREDRQGTGGEIFFLSSSEKDERKRRTFLGQKNTKTRYPSLQNIGDVTLPMRSTSPVSSSSSASAAHQDRGAPSQVRNDADRNSRLSFSFRHGSVPLLTYFEAYVASQKERYSFHGESSDDGEQGDEEEEEQGFDSLLSHHRGSSDSPHSLHTIHSRRYAASSFPTFSRDKRDLIHPPSSCSSPSCCSSSPFPLRLPRAHDPPESLCLTSSPSSFPSSPPFFSSPLRLLFYLSACFNHESLPGLPRARRKKAEEKRKKKKKEGKNRRRKLSIVIWSLWKEAPHRQEEGEELHHTDLQEGGSFEMKREAACVLGETIVFPAILSYVR